jgi:D-aspartate ligase
MRPAIVVSGHTAALGVVRSLGAMGVPIVLVHNGNHDFAGRSRFVSFCYRAPDPEQSEREFINFLLGCGARFPGAVLIPTTDDSLVAISRHKVRLEQHLRVACTDWEVTRKFIDKQVTYALAECCGVHAPRTLTPRSLEEARSGARDIGLPCLVKPCQSHLYYARFGRKMVRVDTLAQLEEIYRNATDAKLNVMLQELIPGDDTEVVNYNAYVWEGEFLAEFTAIHVRNGPPWFGPPRVVVSRRVPEVIESGRRMLRALGFSGFACTEFKWDARDGVYKVLDVNGRHNLSTLLAVRCGINFPWLHYRHLSEGIEPLALEFREEMYWIDLVRDIGFTARYLTRERHSLINYLRPYLRPHVFAIFDRSDIGPFLRRVVSYRTKKESFGPRHNQ